MPDTPPEPEVAAAPRAIDCRILLVDPDADARQALEQSLASSGRYQVHVAHDADGAVYLLGHTIIDLVIADADAGLEQAFGLLRRLRREPRWRTLPVFFVGASGDAPRRVSAFQQGVDDVLSKPVSVPELMARVDALMRRVRLARSKWRGRRYELAGNFRGLAFSDLLTILENGQRSGMLSIMTRRGGGALFFEDGRIRHATFATLQGPDAVYRLFAETEGEFEFLSGRSEQEVPQTIFGSPTGLMLEAARRLDQYGGPADAPSDCAPELRFQAALEERQRTSAEDVRSLAQALSDPFNLGELALLRAEELDSFLSEVHAPGALQLLLVAPLESGVLALSALAAPLSEGQVSKCLSRSARALTFSFSAGAERVLELLLVDPDEPYEAFGERWPPVDAMILAPGGGDWLSLSISSRVALSALIARCQPQLVHTLGNQNLTAAVSEVLLQASPSSELINDAALINDPDCDFRAVIVTALGALERHLAATPRLARPA
jgi:CheY-like chemotaxis protein